MKKFMPIALAVLMLVSSFMVPVSAAGVSKSKIHNEELLKATPVIDGEIDELYQKSLHVQFESPAFSGVDTESVANVYALHDDNYIYVAAHITDTTPYEPNELYLKYNSHPHETDAFEIRVAADGHIAPYASGMKHHLLFIDAQGRRFSSYYDSLEGFSGKTIYKKGEYYTVEVAIPLTSPLVKDESIMLNFQVDNMTGTPEDPQFGATCLTETNTKLDSFVVNTKRVILPPKPYNPQPLKPAEPEKPVEPEVPVEPEIPVEPEKPTEPETPVEVKNPFSDITEDDWYYDAVLKAFSSGFMNGTTESTFEPNLDVTRAMFVTALYRLDGEKDVATENIFEDIEDSAYYSKAVSWAKTNNVVNGITATTFAPNDKITREQMAAMIYRYATYKGISLSDDSDAKLSYTDADKISTWATEAVLFCNIKGFMSGNDNLFAPFNNAKRAEVATVFARLLEAIK